MSKKTLGKEVELDVPLLQLPRGCFATLLVAWKLNHITESDVKKMLAINEHELRIALENCKTYADDTLKAYDEKKRRAEIRAQGKKKAGEP